MSTYTVNSEASFQIPELFSLSTTLSNQRSSTIFWKSMILYLLTGEGSLRVSSKLLDALSLWPITALLGANLKEFAIAIPPDERTKSTHHSDTVG